LQEEVILKDVNDLLRQIENELKSQEYQVHRQDDITNLSINVVVFKPEIYTLPWKDLEEIQKNIEGVWEILKDKSPIEKLRFLSKGKLNRFADGDYNVK